MIWILYQCKECQKKFPIVKGNETLTCCGPLELKKEVVVNYEKVKRPTTKQYSR